MRCLKAFGERIAARHPDSQTPKIQICVTLINCANARRHRRDRPLGQMQPGKAAVRPYVSGVQQRLASLPMLSQFCNTNLTVPPWACTTNLAASMPFLTWLKNAPSALPPSTIVSFAGPKGSWQEYAKTGPAADAILRRFRKLQSGLATGVRGSLPETGQFRNVAVCLGRNRKQPRTFLAPYRVFVCCSKK